jgi:hypothetical protein
MYVVVTWRQQANPKHRVHRLMVLEPHWQRTAFDSRRYEIAFYSTDVEPTRSAWATGYILASACTGIALSLHSVQLFPEVLSTASRTTDP